MQGKHQHEQGTYHQGEQYATCTGYGDAAGEEIVEIDHQKDAKLDEQLDKTAGASAEGHYEAGEIDLTEHAGVGGKDVTG